MGLDSTRALLWVSLGLGVMLSCASEQSSDQNPDGSAGTPGAAGAGIVVPTGGSSGAGLGNAGASGSPVQAGPGGNGGTSGSAGVSGSAGSGGASLGGSGGNAGASGNAGTGGVSAGASGSGGASGAGGSSSTSGAGGTSAGAGGAAGGGGYAGAGGSVNAAGATGSGGAGGAGSIGATYQLKTFVINSIVPPSTISSTVKVSWDATKIEFFFDVKDTTPKDDSANNWEDDAVEIYLDLNHPKSTTFQGNDVQIIVPRAAGVASGLGPVTFASVGVVRAEVTGGYTLDISVPWSAVGNGASQVGKTITIDLAVDDDANADPGRDAQLMLYGTDQAFNDTSFYGDLILN